MTTQQAANMIRIFIYDSIDGETLDACYAELELHNIVGEAAEAALDAAGVFATIREIEIDGRTRYIPFAYLT